MSQLIRGKDKNIDKEKRIVVIDHEKCKPKTPAYDYLVAKSKMCNKECIVKQSDKIIISEEACMMCFNLAKRTPGDSISVVKLPTNLTTNVTHCYGPNSFKIHGLPAPQTGSVLGLLGTNGIGKSTAIKILSGSVIPNFGKFDRSSTTKDIINYYRGSELQNYFTCLYKGKMKMAIKPQSISEYSLKYKGVKVIDVLSKSDKRNKLEKIASKLELLHLSDRNIEELSGGELQRLAIAITLLDDVDVYFFDECSSFLDVKQRIIVTDLIRGINDPNEWEDKSKATSKYVIVVEHDLAILDYMSDYIQSIYGKPGAYGVVTKKSVVSNGINQFMEGYISSENIRFRQYELTFKNNAADEIKNSKGNQKIEYPNMEKKYDSSNFKINIERGSFSNGEITCLMGENGSGKTTFMNLLAENLRENKILQGFSVSHKPQNLDYSEIDYTVQELLEKKINSALGNRNFKFIVLNPLKIESIKDQKVNTLSGGQIQRLAIAICLGTPASVYLIDEPSAGLDCEQRVVIAKVIQKWIIDCLNKSCFLIEHDFLMTSTIADKVVVYEGTPGIECIAKTPVEIGEGFNKFLKNLNVTFRRDPNNYRPRINKKNSSKDKEQKLNNEYFLFDK